MAVFPLAMRERFKMVFGEKGAATGASSLKF